MRFTASWLTVLTVGFLVRADDWPQWRGVDRTGVSRESGLLAAWPKDGPPLRWTAKEIGTGYSAPCIVNGHVFLQTTHGEREFALALDEKTGTQVWTTYIGKVGKNQGPPYPGTRSTPTFDSGHLYCLASDGELVCLEALKGLIKWQKHLRTDFGGTPGMWVYSESLLVDGDAVVCTPGGPKSTLVALNKMTGDTLWKSEVPDAGNAEYASIMTVTVGGVRQYVQFLRKGVVGVAAKDGKFLWRYGRTVDQGANILTPVISGNKVFSAGSRTGGGLVELTADDSGVKAAEKYFVRNLAPSIGGAVLFHGYLYGSSGQTLFCADVNTGDIKWTDRSVGPASICAADGKLYVRGYNSGEVALVDPSPDAYREISRFKQPQRSKIQAWPHPVVANGGFYLRDQQVLLCYDVKAKSSQ